MEEEGTKGKSCKVLILNAGATPLVGTGLFLGFALVMPEACPLRPARLLRNSFTRSR